MYFEYFGLKQPPFRITPDTNLFFPGANRGAVLEALIYAVGNGEGIVKVVGEVGSGKTMLCRMLEQELPERVEVVYLANPSLSPENILHVIAFELKLPVAAGTPRLEVMRALQDYLLQRHSENRQVVVFVEEAQGMPIATLEEIRLLSNLETRHNKLLQIVLFGQPELDQTLALPEIRQLKERITYSFQLPPFNPNDIRDYLNARVRACGYRAAELFSPAAVRAIADHSQGLVRRINILADKSLLAAYADTNIQVGRDHVLKAARDSEFVSARRRRWWLPATAGLACVLALAAGAWWWTDGRGGSAPVAVEALAPAPPTTAPSQGQPPETGATSDSTETAGISGESSGSASEVDVAKLAEDTSNLPEDSASSSPESAQAAPGPTDSGASGDTLPGPESAPVSGVEAGMDGAPDAEQEAPDPAPAATEESADASRVLFQLLPEVSAPGREPRRALQEAVLARLPPEEAPAPGGVTDLPPCEVCSGIIYRYTDGQESL